MAVNLSPYGGVGAQFLDNSGNVLTGGKIFTYAAGTTTPQATYTSSNGVIPHPNPIILDAAGRVPGGEIWLTDGLSYKFILRDSNDVLIATYDNVIGINSNFVNFTNQQEIQTATAGQTVFNLTTINYQPGTNSLSVFVDGVNQYGPGAQYAYLETDSDTVTFVNGLHVGAEVKFTTSQLNTSGGTNASAVVYDPASVNAVATTVQAKLRETVSVKDFGAVGDGVTDDTVAIQTALNSGASCIFVPEGVYIISDTLQMPTMTTIRGVSAALNQYNRSIQTGSILRAATGSLSGAKAVIQAGTVSELGNIEIHNLVIDIANADSTAIGIKKESCNHFVMMNIYVSASFGTSTQIAYFNGNGTHGYFENINLMGGKISIYMDNTTGRECHDSVYNKVWMYPAAITGAICIYFPVGGGRAITTWIMPYMETDSSGLVTGIKTENLAAPEMTMIYPSWDGTFANRWELLFPNRSKLIGSNLADLSTSFSGPVGRMINIGREGSQLIEKLYLYDIGQEIQFGVDSAGFHFGRISGGAAKISKIQGGVKTEVIGVVNSGATFTDTITVAGCTVGAPVSVGIDWTGAGSYTLTATVVNAVTVRYWLRNNDSSPVDFGTRVLKAVVFNGSIT